MIEGEGKKMFIVEKTQTYDVQRLCASLSSSRAILLPEKLDSTCESATCQGSLLDRRAVRSPSSPASGGWQLWQVARAVRMIEIEIGYPDYAAPE